MTQSPLGGYEGRKEKTMTTIEIYDYDMMRIESIAKRWDLKIREVIEILLENVHEDEEEFIFA